MNVRKPIDYNAMYAELDEILSEKLPQMEEIHMFPLAFQKECGKL